MNRREFLAGLSVVAQGKLGTYRQRLSLLDGIESVVTVRQPYLQNVRHDRASVLWATQAPGLGWVEYTTDGVSFKRVYAKARTFPPSETYLPSPFTQYTAQISRLLPNTTYTYYPIVDGDAASPASRFRTAGPGSFRFLVLGDSGTGTIEQGRIAQQLAVEQASFLIHVGDIAYGHGNYPEFQNYYFAYYEGLMSRMPFFTCPGNHDYDTEVSGEKAAPYFALHCCSTDTVSLPEHGRYYSFDWGNAHFVSLDTNLPLFNAINGTGDMFNWLERDLRSTRQFWKIVFFHHPPYAGGPNLGDPPSRLAETYLTPILERNGVQLVLNGHEHNYQRSFLIKGGVPVTGAGLTGTLYLTSGGGGGGTVGPYTLYTPTQIPQVAYFNKINQYVRVEVTGMRLTLRAIDMNGIEFDTFVLSPPPVTADIDRPITVQRSTGTEELIRIRGFNLAPDEMFPAAGNGVGTTLSIDGTPIPLIYVSPTQIWGKLPFSFPLTGVHRFTVTTGNGTMDKTVAVS